MAARMLAAVVSNVCMTIEMSDRRWRRQTATFSRQCFLDETVSVTIQLIVLSIQLRLIR